MRILSVVLSLAVLLAGAARAQVSTPRLRVTDSLFPGSAPHLRLTDAATGLPLRRDGDLFQLTDSAAALPTGVRVESPWHAAFGVAMAVPVRATASGTLSAATPSLQSLAAQLCGAQPQGTVAVLGRSESPDDAAPLPYASVRAVWQEVAITNRGLATTVRQRAGTLPQGRLLLCGLPAGEVVQVVGQTEGGDSVAVTLQLPREPLAWVNLPALQTAAGDSAVGELRLRDLNDARLTGVEVQARGRAVDVTVAPFAGELVSLDGVLPAGGTLVLRQLGRAPVRLAWSAGVRVSGYRFLWPTSAVELPEIVNTVRPPAFDGPALRKRASLGAAFDSTDIAKSGAPTIGAFLRRVPGAKIDRSGTLSFGRSEGQIGKYGNQLCVPIYVVDGTPRTIFTPLEPGGLTDWDGGPGQLVNLEDVLAIEVYRSLSEAPVQFAGFDSGCGVVLIWTKASRRSNR